MLSVWQSNESLEAAPPAFNLELQLFVAEVVEAGHYQPFKHQDNVPGLAPCWRFARLDANTLQHWTEGFPVDISAQLQKRVTQSINALVSVFEKGAKKVVLLTGHGLFRAGLGCSILPLISYF